MFFIESRNMESLDIFLKSHLFSVCAWCHEPGTSFSSFEEIVSPRFIDCTSSCGCWVCFPCVERILRRHEEVGPCPLCGGELKPLLKKFASIFCNYIL